MPRLRLPMSTSLLALAAVLAMPAVAVAQTFDIKHPEAKARELELGLDNTFHSGGGDSLADFNRRVHEFSLDYGVTNWWRLSGVLKTEHPEGGDYRVAAVAIENVLVLHRAEKGFGLGLFAGTDIATHRDVPDAVQIGPIIRYVADNGLSLTANPFFLRQWGDGAPDGIALSYGWQIKQEIGKGIALGIEAFGVVENLGSSPPWSEQEHRIGPVLYLEHEIAKDRTISTDIGILFGLTPGTPDVAIKFNVGIGLGQFPR